MMLRYQFNINLEEVARGVNFTEIVYQVVAYFYTRNRLEKLINKALNVNPDNPDLKAIKEKFKITTILVKILLPLEKNFINQMQQAYQACCPDQLFDDWEDDTPDNLYKILENLDNIPKYNYQEIPIVKFVYCLLKTGEIPNIIAAQLKEWIKENAKNYSDLLANEDFTEEVNSDAQHNSPKNAQVLQQLSYANLVRPPLALNKFSSANPSELKQFSFEVVTVNRKGVIIKKENKQANYFTQDLGNGIDLEMLYIPEGRFLMGSPESEKGSDDSERPHHQVTIPPFFLGKYPVTQAQWRAVANLPKINRDLDPDPSRFKGENRPVEQVNWFDAVEFCVRLSDYTGTEYRLPNEAEWEYACRAGTTTPFHYGETITSKLANYRASYTYAEEAEGEYRGESTPVGSFPPNGFGLYDMHGNVWEWCEDAFHDNYEGAPEDGSVWTIYNNHNYYYLRGGSWFYYPWLCRSASRILYNARGSIDLDVGFRVARGVGRS
ncbi:MAG: formylglycine-generating enzyme family protein [Moorea sp. SIO3H5]|nr:formylglycine-generating enzyme family protein [Moorena sp. SIO3H5]